MLPLILRNSQTVAVDPLRAAQSVAAEMMDAGAKAVALVGSHARGEAHRHSDLDIIALGEGDDRMSIRDDFLVSEAWLAANETERIWSDVAYVGQTVPGWRRALPLIDPHGEINALKQRARHWTWDELGNEPDRWVDQHFTGYAEEVFRLTGHLVSGRRWPAAVMRNVCANRMAWILGVHFRLLYETENRLWTLVGERMDGRWHDLQDAAFGVSTTFESSCWAAIDLFAVTAETVEPVLTAPALEVVRAALASSTEARRGAREPFE